MIYPNWFKQIAQHNFERFLIPLAGQRNLQFLQLGVFTGDASLWLAQNVLTGVACRLHDVDTWQGADNELVQEEMDFNDVYAIYKEKIKFYLSVISFRETTTSYLMGSQYESYDFIYVDAHHTSASAFLDCELSWPLLVKGGILAIDDYEWVHPDGVDIHAPKTGIHMFLDRHAGEYEELVINQQCWIRKV